MTDMNEETASRSNLLYSLLAGILHERGIQILKTVQDLNGFEAYRLISEDLQPLARTRALALLQAINNWPAFSMKQGLSNQLARLQEAEQEYKRVTASKLSDNHRMAVLLRCLSGPLKAYTNIVVTEGSSYAQLCSLVQRWETSQTKWTNPINSMFHIKDQPHSEDTSSNMEVDRIKGGWSKQGKGKHKGDQKGKFSKGKFEKGGKSKGKGKYNNSKGKGSKGKTGKGSYDMVAGDACLYCGKTGHWKRDCFRYKKDQEQASVKRAEESHQAYMDHGTSSAASKTAQSVRRVYSMDDGTDVFGLTIYEMDDEQEDAAFYDVRMISFAGISDSAVQCFDMTYSDGDSQWECAVRIRGCVGLRVCCIHVRWYRNVWYIYVQFSWVFR